MTFISDVQHFMTKKNQNKKCFLIEVLQQHIQSEFFLFNNVNFHYCYQNKNKHFQIGLLMKNKSEDLQHT